MSGNRSFFIEMSPFCMLFDAYKSPIFTKTVTQTGFSFIGVVMS